jgi:hypothetical protein
MSAGEQKLYLLFTTIDEHSEIHRPYDKESSKARGQL